jgi:LSD1 subclass zinc finger protein
MLSSTAREAVVRKLQAKVGHPIDEAKLSPGTSQAIANLSVFQRHLFVISKILNGEQGRVEHSTLLTLTSKIHKDREIERHVEEIRGLQAELDAKISEIATQITAEEKAILAGQPLPEREGGIEAVELKCSSCGAVLPMPTGRFVRCQYCNATLSIQDVSPQIRSMIQNI